MTIYNTLSNLALVFPFALFVVLTPFTARFFFRVPLPAFMRSARHDALFSAAWLLMLNRVWLGMRHIVFGSHLDSFSPLEAPYLEASFVWAVISVVGFAMVLYGYWRGDRS